MSSDHGMRAIWAGLLAALAVAAGCTSESDPARTGPAAHRPLRKNEKELDVESFRRTLQSPDRVAEIEEIRIEPLGHGAALYVVTLKPTGTKQVVYAEFPGRIVDEINTDGIAYVVGTARDTSTTDTTMDQIDAMTFRHSLGKIESIRIEPLGRDDARYIFAVKGNTRPRVVYAEFPGRVVDEIKAAGVPYSITDH